jgi:hypothetical protein
MPEAAPVIAMTLPESVFMRAMLTVDATRPRSFVARGCAALQTRAMGDLVNLNRFRKAKERAEKERIAEANRVKFGRTKAERQKQAKQRALEQARHDGNKLEPEPPTEAPPTKK